jgi:hypothetical protein
MKALTQEQKDSILKFLNNLDIDIVITDYVDIEEINIENAYEYILEVLQENGGFNVEIVYYARAVEYLKENDPSLKESLGIANEFGFSLDSLNSETLASLLASRNAEEQFYELQSEIDEFFQDLCDELETEEDEDYELTN